MNVEYLEGLSEEDFKFSKCGLELLKGKTVIMLKSYCNKEKFMSSRDLAPFKRALRVLVGLYTRDLWILVIIVKVKPKRGSDTKN